MAAGRFSISIVGCGPGSADYVTPAARAAVADAEVLVGTRRLLDLFAEHPGERIELGPRVASTLDRLDQIADCRTVAVLVTGDPGLFSLSRLVVERFGRDRCTVIPGVSSVQVAFARIGLDWANARILSAHKEDPAGDPSLVQAEKIAVFCGRPGSFAWIARHLLPEGGSGRRVFVLENLTLEDERVREVDAHEIESVQASSRSIVVIIREGLIS